MIKRKGKKWAMSLIGEGGWKKSPDFHLGYSKSMLTENRMADKANSLVEQASVFA